MHVFTPLYITNNLNVNDSVTWILYLGAGDGWGGEGERGSEGKGMAARGRERGRKTRDEIERRKIIHLSIFLPSILAKICTFTLKYINKYTK